MPSTSHEVLVATLHEQPSLLASLVHVMTGRTLAPGLEPVDSALRFADAAEVRPDLVLAEGQRWTVVEVQNECDPAKQRRWILAAGVLLDQKGVLGDVIVITARRSVAAWARTVAHHETPLGTKLQLTPVVLHVGPEMLDRLLSDQQPELAIIASWAMSHRRGPASKKVVLRALELGQKLPEALQKAHRDAIMAVLSPSMVAWIEEMTMNPGKITLSPALLKLKAALREEGLAEGEAKGLAEGEAKGEARGKRGALLALMAARGLSPTAGEKAELEGCTDPDRLDHWIVRAVTAASVREVLAAKAPARSATPKTAPAKRTPTPKRRAVRA